MTGEDDVFMLLRTTAVMLMLPAGFRFCCGDADGGSNHSDVEVVVMMWRRGW